MNSPNATFERLRTLRIDPNGSLVAPGWLTDAFTALPQEKSPKTSCVKCRTRRSARWWAGRRRSACRSSATVNSAAKIASLGMIPTENGTAHYAQFIREDYDRYAAVVKALGLKAE